MIELRSCRIVRASALAALALACPLLAASGSGADRPGGEVISEAARTDARAPVATVRPAQVQGTIEATVDGQRITWYSVSGESGGAPYSSSTWTEFPGSERIVTVGGFSTDDPPLDSFEWDDSGMPASYGTYDGSIFALAIQMSGDANSFTVSFPDPGGSSLLSYQPRATFEDVLSTTFMVAEGALSVTDVGIDGGLARAEGTFSGTFRLMAGDGSVVVTDGVFAVEAIPSLETIRR